MEKALFCPNIFSNSVSSSALPSTLYEIKGTKEKPGLSELVLGRLVALRQEIESQQQGPFPWLKESYVALSESLSRPTSATTLIIDTQEGLSDKAFLLGNVKAIILKESSITTLAWIKLFPQLESLDLTGCQNIRDFSGLVYCPVLKKLNLKSTFFQDFALLKPLKALRELSLEYTRIDDCGQFATFRQLQVINLRHTPLGVAVDKVAALSALLPNCKIIHDVIDRMLASKIVFAKRVLRKRLLDKIEKRIIAET